MSIPLRKHLVLHAIFVSISAVCLCAQAPSNSAPASQYLKEATQGIVAMQGWYNPATGLYRTTGWWNSANAITVLTNYSRAAGTQEFTPTLANTFKAAQTQNRGFINKYYDDEGWWALAWIDAYDLTHTPQYLSMAQSIFTDMAGGWDTTTCGGGIWWSKDKTYKNAIANELFLSVAAHLTNRTSGDDQTIYEDWSRREWTWFLHSGMINAQDLINDGLDSSNPGACRNNEMATWSYNQGVVLAGLAEFSRFNSDPSLLSIASQIAKSAITYLTDGNGILHDPCEPKCGADGPQFKGIFVRNLMALDQIAPNATYKAFIHQNANSILRNNQSSSFTFGLIWSGPFDSADAASQSSALDAIIAAAVIDR
jgi:predicted alpha-1,6-mannanase (GH76 family)